MANMPEGSFEIYLAVSGEERRSFHYKMLAEIIERTHRRCSGSEGGSLDDYASTANEVSGLRVMGHDGSFIENHLMNEPDRVDDAEPDIHEPARGVNAEPVIPPSEVFLLELSAVDGCPSVVMDVLQKKFPGSKTRLAEKLLDTIMLYDAHLSAQRNLTQTAGVVKTRQAPAPPNSEIPSSSTRKEERPRSADYAEGDDE